MKKILCLIESLGGGGAERQLSGLAVMMKEHGHNVKLFYHDDMHFYVPYLEENGIHPQYISEARKRSRRYAEYKNKIKEFEPDIVVSFSQSTSIPVCIMKAMGAKFKLIVSERNTTQSLNFGTRVRFWLYRYADYVVPNSYSQGEFVTKTFPELKEKVKVITNFTDLEKFSYSEHIYKKEPLIAIAATIWSSKNTLGFIEAVKILKQRNVRCHIKWYGYVKACEDYFNKCVSLVEQYQLNDTIEFLPKTHEIAKVYQESNFLCLPSFYEGTPNVICEAISSGLPVICSRICDNHLYVIEGENGYLFNPKSPEDMANVIEKAINMTEAQYTSFSNKSREIAESKLSKAVFYQKYNTILV